MTNDIEQVLEPCPFDCGRDHALAPSGWMLGTAREMGTQADVWAYAVRCLCGAQGPERNSEVEAIDAWNTRSLSSLSDRVVATRAEAFEEAAKIAEAADDDWRERVIPAHDEYDDWGDLVFRIPERVEKVRLLPSGKSIAASIRAMINAAPPAMIQTNKDMGNE